MKFLNSLLSTLAVFGMATQLLAQEVETEVPAAETAPVMSVDELLAFVPDVVAATQDGTPVLTRAQIFKEFRPQLEGALAQGISLPQDMVQGFIYQMTESLVMRHVLVQAAQKAGFESNQEEAQQVLDNMKQQAEQQQPGMFAAQLAQLGMTENDILARICEQQLLQKLQESFAEKVEKPAPTTEEEARAFYEQNTDQMVTPKLLSASHILVQFPSQTPTEDEKAAALEKIQKIRLMLNEDGSNFKEIASTNSDCPSSQQGGDLGSFPVGSMVPEFEEALLKLEEGQISEPVETIFGYHLILAGATQEEKTTPFEEIKDRIIAYLDNQKANEVTANAVNGEMEKLMQAANITIFLPKPAALEEDGEGEIDEAQSEEEAPAAEAPAAED